VELARMCTQEKGTERLHDNTRVDTRGLKGETGAKHHVEKNCREREEQSRMDEPEGGQNSSTQQGGLGVKCGSLMHLLA